MGMGSATPYLVGFPKKYPASVLAFGGICSLDLANISAGSGSRFHFLGDQRLDVRRPLLECCLHFLGKVMLLVNPNQRPVADAALVVQAKLGDLQRYPKPCEAGRERAAKVMECPMLKAWRLDRRTRLAMAASKAPRSKKSRPSRRRSRTIAKIQKRLSQAGIRECPRDLAAAHRGAHESRRCRSARQA